MQQVAEWTGMLLVSMCQGALQVCENCSGDILVMSFVLDNGYIRCHKGGMSDEYANERDLEQ